MPDDFDTELARVVRRLESLSPQEAHEGMSILADLAQELSDATADALDRRAEPLSELAKQRASVTVRAVAADAKKAGVNLTRFTERLVALRHAL